MSKLSLLALSMAIAAPAVAAPPSLFQSPPLQKIAAAAVREQRVTLNPDALEQAIVERGMWIATPSGQRVFARTSRHQFLPDGTLLWVGKVRLKDASERTVMVASGKDASFGALVAEDGSPLKLDTRKGATYLIVPDPMQDADRISAAKGLKASPDFIEAQPMLASAKDALRTKIALAKTAGPVVDVFVGYTPGLVTRYGSQSAALTRINYLVSVTNQAFIDSQVDATLRLVGTKQVAYPETETNSATLDALGDRSGVGPLQVLRDARRASGADMLTIVRPFLTPEHGNCGLATVNGSNLGPYTTASGGGANAAISDGTDDNSTTYCKDTTFSHELGHNWGLVHDSANSDKPGPFPYTFGWKRDLPGGGFYTLMAYGSSGQSPAPYYSNPDIYLCKGQPCGDAGTANQARALRTTLRVASAFNQPLDPLIDIDGDGMADLVLQNDGAMAFILYRGTYAAYGGKQTMGAGFRLVAAGDFNGDHRTDFVWNSDAREPQIWTAQADYTFQTTAKSVTSWDVIGAADLSGDGKSDILFTKPGETQLRVWVMNGTSTASVKCFDITAGYRVVAARDFDGDGLIDLMWANADRRLEYWKNNGNTTFTIVQTGLQYPQGWTLVGSGDFNNDNKADLAFDTNALLLSAATVWTMDGGGRIGTQSVSGPLLELLHSPIAVDRYGGATASMLWTSGILRDMWMSLNDGTGANYNTTSVYGFPSDSSGSFYRNYPAGWTVFTGAPIAP
ncbi:reprolysin-like metallopeptidase [Lysobacter enzymogenes]|uniref:reprolysin-like metallopeptidase n=1 Tax=Lysobacter enzymogenes TaxID=69 RepID=UPI00089C28E4|nr:FG-GAP-like repeat-containing protein [Lysobacter enzymogenes]SDX14436.1 Repeat domain-containing protein [Lysobacter enzymogenes]